MGLAAGQARLLTITGRKSDCEFASMRLSHEKIALSRELADISNEYQNSLEQTKLIFDYYGTGNTDMPLSYSLLMTPSALNDYTPILLSDSMNRIVLNSKYARAAEEAGIPREGLGCLPSETLRNDFINALYGQDLINKNIAEKIVDLPYNQAAGLGGGATVVTNTQEVSYDELKKMLAKYSAKPTESLSVNKEYTRSINLYNNISNEYYCNELRGSQNAEKGIHDGSIEYKDMGSDSVNLKDILEGDYVLVTTTRDEWNSELGNTGGAIDAIVHSEFWGQMYDAVNTLFDTGDAYTQQALAYAQDKIEYLIQNNCEPMNPGGHGGDSESKTDKWRYNQDQYLFNFTHREGTSDQSNDYTVISKALRYATDSNEKIDSSNGYGYIGLCMQFNCGQGRDDDSDISAVSVNLSNVFKAYLTYFVDFMTGLSKTDKNGDELYCVKDTVSSSKLINGDTKFNIKIGTDVSSDDLALATFYDTLFNQLCLHGWCENNNVNDNDYLKELLQNGMVYISNLKDDNYYYQENYATDKYIKEVADESLIAQAEAKYNTEKAKLNAKEETIDLKMKNLDTEISALTTEYDTVKNTISKNVERSFKRYSA